MVEPKTITLFILNTMLSRDTVVYIYRLIIRGVDAVWV